MERQPEIERLGAARQRVLQTHDQLDDLDADPPAWALQRSMFNRACDQYLDALKHYRQSTTSAERRSTLDTWRARLATGWARTESERVIARFEQVLREYEALCDAERGREAVSAQFTHWINTIEQERARLTALAERLRGEYQARLAHLNPTTWPEFWSAVRLLPDVPGDSQSAFIVWLRHPIVHLEPADAWALVQERLTTLVPTQPALI